MMNRGLPKHESPEDEEAEPKNVSAATHLLGHEKTPLLSLQSPMIPPKQKRGTSSSRDSSPTEEKCILVPGAADILCGRGKPFQNHSGNLEMRKLVDEYKDRYQAAPRNRKTLITEEILAKISESGGRFLKQQSADKWVPVTRAVAFEKVSHAFRSRIGGSTSTRGKPSAQARHRKVQQQAANSNVGAGPHHHVGLLNAGELPASAQQHQQRLANSLSSLSTMFPATASTAGAGGAVGMGNNHSLPAMLPQTLASANQPQAPTNSAAAVVALSSIHQSSLEGFLAELPGFASGRATAQFGGLGSSLAGVGSGAGGSNMSQRALYESLLSGASQQQSVAAMASVASQQQQHQSLSSVLAASAAAGRLAQRTAQHPTSQQPQQQQYPSATYEQLRQQNQTIESFLYRQQLNELLANLGIPPSSQQPPPR